MPPPATLCANPDCDHLFQPRQGGRRGKNVWTIYCSRACAGNAPRDPAARQARERLRRQSPMNRQRVKNMARKRKAVRAASWDGVTDEEILERDRWLCWLCRKRIGRKIRYPHPRSASIDHEVPLSLGGDDTALNKHAAHLGCNMARNNHVGQMPLFGYVADVKLPSLERKCKGCGVIFARAGTRQYCVECRAPGQKHPKPKRPRPNELRECVWCGEVQSNVVCRECARGSCSGCGKQVTVVANSAPPDQRFCRECRVRAGWPRRRAA